VVGIRLQERNIKRETFSSLLQHKSNGMCKEFVRFRFLLMMIAWFAHQASNFSLLFAFLWLQHRCIGLFLFGVFILRFTFVVPTFIFLYGINIICLACYFTSTNQRRKQFIGF
jgi:hypothetical protein